MYVICSLILVTWQLHANYIQIPFSSEVIHDGTAGNGGSQIRLYVIDENT